MIFNLEKIAALTAVHFNLEVLVKALPGEIDLNFLVEAPAGEKFNLKIANPGERREILEFQNAMMQRLRAAGLGLEIPQVVHSIAGEEITTLTAPDGSPRLLRLLTWVEGRCFADVNPHTPDLLEKVGEMCGKLSRVLEGFDHPAAHRFIKWDASQAGWTGGHLTKIEGEDKLALAQYFYQLFEKNAVPLLPQLRQSVCYSDANDYNILVSHDPANPVVPGVIDFGDAVFTHTINELAIACAYAAMHKPDPLAAVFHLTKGYHRQFPLTETEAEALFPLIGARLLISVTCSAMNLAENPGNEYLQISDRPAWDLLKKLRNVPPALAHATVRHACGWEPCPKRAAFDKWLGRMAFRPSCPVPFRAAAHGGGIYAAGQDGLKAILPVWLDLSVGSPDLGNYADMEDLRLLNQKIAVPLTADLPESNVSRLPSNVLIGRYDEARPFYTTDAYEVRGNEGPEWRSVHIGLDFFLPPGSPVFAPLDGTVHSFQDNANERDYGPTIILEHQMIADCGLRIADLGGNTDVDLKSVSTV